MFYYECAKVSIKVLYHNKRFTLSEEKLKLKNDTDTIIRIFYKLIKLFHTVRRLIYGEEEMVWMN
ncbi:hypothetical protein COM08_02675 [Bacillus wiedmannii]|uniref:Uncharacterized protein n=1 Tax=Bacillus wiedmannii TaxID=1890302 RepID=A0A2B5J1M5_9BACI|nr:hypothetical protein COL51_00580 [Bacillus wiedmannii]PGC22113.1 hypothetical protein COM08_02675 [Bacillus wiedmannii]PGC60491.1 hypothetical protein COM22_00820 [Bacillus wiedmannii]PGD32353.1 hypothetical protein COM27_20890 [Bacillus wiedmannii]PHE68936.1 hypothetical protein COF77_28465 [Bacillus wiedmannii]